MCQTFPLWTAKTTRVTSAAMLSGIPIPWVMLFTISSATVSSRRVAGSLLFMLPEMFYKSNGFGEQLFCLWAKIAIMLTHWFFPEDDAVLLQFTEHRIVDLLNRGNIQSSEVESSGQAEFCGDAQG